jgi:hypothetical protein
MSRSVQISPRGVDRWITWDSNPTTSEIRERCNVEHISSALSGLDGVQVVSAEINSTGEFTLPALSAFEGMPPGGGTVTGLPEFCDVRVEQISPAGHVAEVLVWVPLDWNGRFLGTGGAGNRTDSVFVPPFDVLRVLTPAIAVRNGFATAGTNGGVSHDAVQYDWQLIEESRELDWDLIENWVHRSTHEMTVIGKLVTKAIHGVPPRYSYFAGCSGGGRQALVEAQRYPDDYDGIWASDPAINWTKLMPSEVWPSLVMKEFDNPLPPEKLEAFRTAVRASCPEQGAREGAGKFRFDAASVVGTTTVAGAVTPADAEVMQKIWDGPRTTAGDFLWYGLRPGAESWGQNLLMTGLYMTKEIDGRLAPSNFDIAVSYFQTWLLRDPDWDWTTLTFATFDMLFERGVEELSAIASDDPDLSAFHDRGAKLILSHALNDEVITPDGSVDYYERVAELADGEVATFLRLFLSPGDGHSHFDGGAGMTIANAVAALMEWVENGSAPNSIIAERFDLATQQMTERTNVVAYGM